MNRLSLLGFVGVLAGALAGCPIYDDGPHGEATGGCKGRDCDEPLPAGACSSAADCDLNETCGSDNECHPGDCTFWGCASPLQCVIRPEDNTAVCEDAGASVGAGGAGAGGSNTGGSNPTGTGGSGGDGPIEGAVYCGNPDDCAASETCAPDGTCHTESCKTIGCIYGYACSGNNTCEPANPAACGADTDCSGAGSGFLCVSGICTAPADQCSDQTQCKAGNKCVDGKCTASCTADSDCATGYACDQSLSICSKPASTCMITNDCGSATSVCVDGACVPRSDGAACPKGTVWVENGCVPDQAATFFCAADGVQGTCAAGSICLHHNCYISCASPNTTACDNLPSFNICKSVTTSTGTYSVCGSSQNLGGECDPTQGLDCGNADVCMDGFCK